MSTNPLEQHWHDYLAAYGPISPTERAQLLDQSVADDIEFTNPAGVGQTRSGLIAHIEDFQRKMPGTTFGTDRTYVHHGELLAVWSMYKADGTRVAGGYNFVRPDASGRFKYMAGFF